MTQTTEENNGNYIRVHKKTLSFIFGLGISLGTLLGILGTWGF